MAAEFLDLFGFAESPERGPGRPQYSWTEEKSNRVNILFACGYEPKQVAPVMGCCLRTFRRVFARECRDWRNARLKMKSRQMLRLNTQADAGNVAAEKALAGMIQAEHREAVNDRMQGRQAKPAKAKPLGKKEEQQQAANGVSGKFAPPAPPALLN